MSLLIRVAAAALLTYFGGVAPVRAGDPPFVPPERLPRVGTVGDLPPEKERLILEADAGGRLRSSGTALDLPSFRSLLKTRADGLPEEGAKDVSRLGVVLRVDADLPWIGVQWLIRECAGVGVYQVFFAALPEDGGAEGAMAAFLPRRGGSPRRGDAPAELKIVCKHLDKFPATPPADVFPFLVSRFGPSNDQAYRVLVDAESGAPAGSVLQLMDMAIRWGSREVLAGPRAAFPGGKSLEEIVAAVKRPSGPFQVTVGGSFVLADPGGGRRPPAVARVKGRYAGVDRAPPPSEGEAPREKEPPSERASGGTDEKVDLARSLAKALAERGYPVDMGNIRIEERSQDGMAEDIVKQGRMLLSPTYFAGMAAFSHALTSGRPGRPARELDGEAFARESARTMAASHLAYYQPGERRLVFKGGKDGGILAALSDGKHLVAHELVHASQDQERGLEKLFAAHRETVEGTRILSCLIEGEAEAVALSLQADLRAIDAGDLSPEIERILGGEISTLVYAAGRTFMVARYREGGWKAVAAALASPPPSTEQILHPEKRGRDLPGTVTLPPLPLPVVHQDVLGEVEIRRWLLEIGLSHSDAYLAAAGWDGDRLRVHRDASGGKVVLWRSLWDRTLDAEQFAQALKDSAGGIVVRNGRLVDWYFGSNAELAETARRVLAESAASPPVVEEDAATTKAVEEAWVAHQGKQPKQEGETWLHESAGVRIPIPKGWEITEVRGMQIVADVEAAATHGFAPNINCQNLALPSGMDLDGLMEDNRAAFTKTRGIKLDSMEKTTLGGVPALRFEYHGVLSPKMPELHFLGIILIRGKRQVVVTATTMESLWEKQREMLTEAMAGIRTVETAQGGGK